MYDNFETLCLVGVVVLRIVFVENWLNWPLGGVSIWVFGQPTGG